MFDSQTSEDCPRCHQLISAERLQDAPKVCDSCGYIVGNVEKQTQKRTERSSLYMVIALAVVIALGFMHVVSWGSYSLEVLPIEAARLFGMDSTDSVRRLAEICLDTKKLDCVESMYTRLALVEPNGLARLGKFQFSRMKYVEAAESFRQFFTKSGQSGQDLDAAYLYARALSEVGRVEEASKYYDYVFRAASAEELEHGHAHGPGDHHHHD